MATTPAAPGPGGFSYAQAARGRQTMPAAAVAAPAPAPAPTSATATAAAAAAAAAPTSPTSSSLPDMASTKDWADDVEASVRSKVQETVDGSQDTPKQGDLKTSTLERTKLESKIPSSSSGVSSPDIAASATSHDDVSSTAPNGSSLSSWEAKSQSSDTVVPSEPAWIAERKERQSTNKAESPVKSNNSNTNNTTIMPEQKPVVLHEAPPPTVNPWAKRAEEAKSKTPPAPSAAPAKPAGSAGPALRTANTSQSSQKSETSSSSRAQDSAHTPRNRKTESKTPAAQPPSVKDQTSWPTPETSQETERKSSASQPTSEDKIEDDSMAGKPRKKQEWKPVPVVPNIIWETPGVRERTARTSPNTDRAPRGGASTRGRGGPRAAAHATHNDRASTTGEAGTQPSASNNTVRSGRTESTELARADSDQNGRLTKTSSKADAVEDPNNGPIDAAKMQTDTPNDVSKSVKHEPVTPNGGAVARNKTLDQGPVEFVPVENHARAGDAPKEQWSGGRGNARRGGRGRGGNRDTMNGHAYQLPPVHPADYAQYAQHFSSLFAPRSNHQASFGGYGRAGSRAAHSSRTYSLPESYRYSHHFIGQPHFPVQTYGHGFQDLAAFQIPVAAVPGQPDHLQTANTVTAQVDYYFSVDNLANDVYLRKNMDSQGFVLLEVVAAFNRLRTLTTDFDLLKFSCANSEVVEVVLGDDGKERLRKNSDWQRYVMPAEERFVPARNDGPQHVEQIGRLVYPWALRQHMAPQYLTRGPDRTSYNYPYAAASMSSMSPQAMFTPEFPGNIQGGEHNNGTEDGRGRHDRAQAHENGNEQNFDLPITHAVEDADVFPDQKVEQLTVCFKLGKDVGPQLSASSRTFSNGSIDASVVDKDTKPPTSGQTSTPSESGDASCEASTSADKAEQSDPQDLSVFWIKDNDQPVGAMPLDLTPEPYVQLRLKALDQRSRAATGNCPYDLDVLYQFWSHFLIRNFNNNMYTEFTHFAHEDAAERYSTVGRRNLIKFYGEAIKSTNLVPLRVARDFVELAKSEGKKQDNTSLKDLRQAWRDGATNLRNRKRFAEILDDEARQLLEG